MLDGCTALYFIKWKCKPRKSIKKKTWIDIPKNKCKPVDIDFIFKTKLMYQLILFLVLSFVYDSGNCSKSENRVSSYMKLIRLYKQKDDKSTEEICVYFKFYNNIYKLQKKKSMQRLKCRKPRNIASSVLAAMSPSRYTISIFIWLMRNSVDKICP